MRRTSTTSLLSDNKMTGDTARERRSGPDDLGLPVAKIGGEREAGECSRRCACVVNWRHFWSDGGVVFVV